MAEPKRHMDVPQERVLVTDTFQSRTGTQCRVPPGIAL